MKKTNAIRLLLDGDPESETREMKGGREFIASTNPTGRYTHPVTETNRLELLQNGWDYTLKDLLDNYKKVPHGNGKVICIYPICGR